MLANVLQKADLHISALERRLVEKREHAVPRTQSSIYSHGVVIVECVEELHNTRLCM